MTVADAIGDEAAAQGFVACGFARVGPTEGFDDFRAWLDAGHAAGMRYLTRRASLRADPRAVAEGARGIVAVAARYPVNLAPGGFCALARGADYHDVLRRKLRTVVGRIRAVAPSVAVARICVDSAPLLEREWAARAGLGWRGRQGQLVNRRHGACLVLGFILTDLDLPPSAPAPNLCGDCRRCLDACPTGAALGDGLVDARRCLSYLTIEHDGDLPASPPIAPADTLFGCDRCTAVCPWNPPDSEPGVLPELRAAGPVPTVNDIRALDEAAFAARFRGTTVYRSGLPRLRRNARLHAQKELP